MTHLPPPTAVRRAPPVALTRIPPPTFSGNRSTLRDALAAKRAAMAGLEAAWVAASEADAARGAARDVRVDDRSTWDKAVWQRYLAAAAAREPNYMPSIRRLLREIDNLEALLALPTLAGIDRGMACGFWYGESV